MPITLGQTFWLVPESRYAEPREVAIIRVGRSWAYFKHNGNEMRMSAASGSVDGAGYSIGFTLYASKAEYAEFLKFKKQRELLIQYVAQTSWKRGEDRKIIDRIADLLPTP